MKKYFMLAVALLTLTACGNSKEATEQSITLDSRETALESREKVLESKESELTDQSKTIESKEKSLDSREKAVATKESEQKAMEAETAPKNVEETTDAPTDYNPPTDAETPDMQKQYEEENPKQEYTEVQAGEDVQQIANRSGISVDELLELNGMSADNYAFFVGDMLRIK